VAAKAASYAGNPFGGANVLVDESYLYFADLGTVDMGQAVPMSSDDGAIYRVAKQFILPTPTHPTRWEFATSA
jgi:hypothetical protein